MMKNVLFCLLLLLIGSSFTNNKQKVFDIHFETDEDIITEKSLDALDEVITMVENASWGYQINMEVFPDDDKELNRYRLAEITNYLEAADIEAGRVLFYSEKEHIPEELKEHDNFDFIRLTVLLKEKVEQKPILVKTTNEPKNTSNESDNSMPKWAENVVDYQNNVETFTINNYSETLIRLADGTYVEFKPESFVFEDGSIVSTPVKLTTKHSTSKNTAILDEYTTDYEDGYLESRGMIYIEAEAMGKPVKIAEGKSYEIRIPTREYEEGFQTFVGERNQSDGSIGWKLDARSMINMNDTNQRRYTFYTYQKISAEKKREYSAARKTQIKNWQERGVPKDVIKRRLKSAKAYVRRTEDRRLKRRYNEDTGKTISIGKRRRKHRYIKKRAGRAPMRETRRYVIGSPRYEFVEVEVPTPKNRRRQIKRYYVMQNVTQIGLINCDYINNSNFPKCRVIVKAGENENVKIVFTQRFSLFKGIKLKNGDHAFNAMPLGFPAMIISAIKLKNGKIRFSTKRINKMNNDTVTMDNYQTMSEDDYIHYIETMNFNS